MKGGHEFPTADRQGGRGARATRGAGGEEAGRQPGPAAGVRAQWGTRVDAGNARHRANLGLNDESVEGLAKTTGNERFAWTPTGVLPDVRQRLPWGSRRALRGCDRGAKARGGVEEDVDLDVDDLKAWTESFKDLFGEATGDEFPRTPRSSSSGHPRRLRLVDRRPAPSHFGASTGFRTSVGTASTCSRWCSATRGTARARRGFSRDEITGSPLRQAIPAHRQGETWWSACAPRTTCTT